MWVGSVFRKGMLQSIPKGKEGDEGGKKADEGGKGRGRKKADEGGGIT